MTQLAYTSSYARVTEWNVANKMLAQTIIVYVCKEE